MADGREVRDGLLYTKDHEWVRLDGDVATVGITDHAQHVLGDITYVDVPPMGAQVERSGELAAVESAKAAADVFAPVSGTVVAVNEDLEEAPEKVNEDPYGEGWICKLEGVDPAAADGLLSPEQYRELLKAEAE